MYLFMKFRGNFLDDTILCTLKFEKMTFVCTLKLEKKNRIFWYYGVSLVIVVLCLKISARNRN
jgi:hypothetical protein